MKGLLPLACLAVLSAPAFAQTTDYVEVGPKVQIDAERGPVTVVSVQPPLPNAEEYDVTVAELDENGDGRISRSEVPDTHALNHEWHLVDTNNNGYVTEAELAAWD